MAAYSQTSAADEKPQQEERKDAGFDDDPLQGFFKEFK
jgi:hypothetical protein